MITYSIDNLPMVLENEDRIIFNIKKDITLTYSVQGDFLHNTSCRGNSEIFNLLDLNKISFLTQAYGSKPSGGDWPIATKQPKIALLRAVWLLFGTLEKQRNPFSLKEIIDLEDMKTDLAFLGFKEIPNEIFYVWLRRCGGRV